MAAERRELAPDAVPRLGLSGRTRPPGATHLPAPAKEPIPLLEYRCAVDREAIAREQRRLQAEEALEFEREREQALSEQLQERIAEADGWRVDEAAFARIDPDYVDLIRDTLQLPAWGDGEESSSIDEDSFAAGRQSLEEEIARLEHEVETCRRRQKAFLLYLEALDHGVEPAAS